MDNDCLSFDATAVLANLLSLDDKDEGVGITDFKKFFDRLMEKTDFKIYYPDIGSYAIDETLLLHQRYFKKHGNRIYKERNFNLEYFNKKYPTEIAAIFREIAQGIMHHA